MDILEHFFFLEGAYTQHFFLIALSLPGRASPHSGRSAPALAQRTVVATSCSVCPPAGVPPRHQGPLASSPRITSLCELNSSVRSSATGAYAHLHQLSFLTPCARPCCVFCKTALTLFDRLAGMSGPARGRPVVWGGRAALLGAWPVKKEKEAHLKASCN
jgi:hypothetical protein